MARLGRVATKEPSADGDGRQEKKERMRACCKNCPHRLALNQSVQRARSRLKSQDLLLQENGDVQGLADDVAAQCWHSRRHNDGRGGLVRGGACFLLHRSCLEAVVRRAWVDRDWLDGDLG